MGEIHKLTKDGKTLFPATTTDAVVHPQVRAAISSLITEYNISALFPTSGDSDSERYTLQGAVSILNDKLKDYQKIPGIKIIFTDLKKDTQEWRYLGYGLFTDITSWAREDSWYEDLNQEVDNLDENLINDALRKTEQSLSSVEKNQVKTNLDLQLEAKKVTWNSTENLNNYINTGIYTISGYRVNPEDNLPINSYGSDTQISGTLVVNKTVNSGVTGQTLMITDSTSGNTKTYRRTFSETDVTWSDWSCSCEKVDLGLVTFDTLDFLNLPGIYVGSIKNPEEITDDISLVLGSSLTGNTCFKLINTINKDYNNLRCSQILYLQSNVDPENNKPAETIFLRTGNRTSELSDFVFTEFTGFITKAYLDNVFKPELNIQLEDLSNEISGIKEIVEEIQLKESTDYCVAAWDPNSLSPECMETFGNLEFCDEWNVYLLDTTDNTGETTRPVGKLMRNNFLRFEDGSWAPTVGILESRRAECDVALYLSSDGGTTLDLYCEEGQFDPVTFYDEYGMNTKLYNAEGNEVNILRPWETTETKYTIGIGREKTIYLLDNVKGNSGKYWKGIFSTPMTWDGIDISQFELKPTAISPGPCAVIDDNGVSKSRNFFYLYEGYSSSKGLKGELTNCEILYKTGRTYPVSYDYESSTGTRISQMNSMKWARNNNATTTSPLPFAEGGFHALNSYITSYEVFYGTKYLHSESKFTGGICSMTCNNETTWKTNGGCRVKASEGDWIYKNWGSNLKANGYYGNAALNDALNMSTYLNHYAPKEECMESQMVASFAQEMGIAENTEFEFYGNTYWYTNIPETKGLRDGKMNVVIRKKVSGTINMYNSSANPVTLDLEAILKVGLCNGVNLGGDVFIYYGGGYEQVGTNTPETGETNEAGNKLENKGGYPIKLYLEPDQSKWLYEETYTKANYGEFEFEKKYPLLVEEQVNLSGEGYVSKRIPYTGFALTKGGSNTTGECAYHWSGNYWGYSNSNHGYRTRIGLRFRFSADHGSYGFRTSHANRTAAFSHPYSSACAQARISAASLQD